MLRSQDAAQPLSPLNKDWDEPPQLPGCFSDADPQDKLEHDAVFQCPVIRLTRLDTIPLDGQRDFRLGVLGVPVTLETPYMLQGQELCFDRVAVEWGMSRFRVVLPSYVSMMTSRGDGISRGVWVDRALGVAFTGAAALTQVPGKSFADPLVGEGGLPNGARQFSNLLKVQKDWAALGKTIKARGADVTPEEWKNVALFLRRVYQVGGDLEFIAGGFSPDKKKAALALVRDIQKEVEAADAPSREKNVEAFLAAQGSVEKKFNDFMDLFSDVPAEL